MAESAKFEEQSDELLLSLGRAGDEAAFLALYRRHHGAVFRFALFMSGNREVAEEVVQEVFLTLLDDGLKFDGELGTVEAFLIGVTRNQVRRQVRNFAGSVGRFGSLDEAAELEQPVESFPSKTEVDALRRAILALPERYRAVTVLCELEELSYAEAAQKLGCAVGTVRSRLHRARTLLQTKLRRRKQCPISTTNR